MDVKNGELTKTVQHDADAIKRHKEFDLRLNNLFEQYAGDIVARYREILCKQDVNLGRNPLHFAAMSKFTKSLKTLEALLDINIDTVPGWDSFVNLFFTL